MNNKFFKYFLINGNILDYFIYDLVSFINKGFKTIKLDYKINEGFKTLN